MGVGGGEGGGGKARTQSPETTIFEKPGEPFEVKLNVVPLVSQPGL